MTPRQTRRSPCEAAETEAPGSLSVPLGLAIDVIELGGETFVVFDFPRTRDILRPLTEAEKSVVALVLQGLTTTEIAAARGVAKATISSQLQSIYRKLGISSRSESVCKLR
jgi:DNA-binding NarL/FixJ family response regulator